MVLLPLEFSECYLDSPWFRENVQQYEEELERTNSQIKQLIKDGKSMLHACRTQGKMMTQFNDRLQNFQFDFGDNLTDDEKAIADSLKEFGLMLDEVAAEWQRTIERSEIQLIKPLELFRKEKIHSYRESKKTFEKASERYYKQLENTLSLSHKKKGQQLQDYDNDLTHLKKHFHREALKYVCKLQEVQERKKFEFVEHLLMFMQVYFNFFHQTHETATDYKDYMKHLQIRLVSTRERYDGTRDKTNALMGRMAEQLDSEENAALSNADRWSRAGYLFLNEKTISARLTSKWTKYFCMYTKENKVFKMISPHHSSSNASLASVGSRVNLTTSSGPTLPMKVKTCTRRVADTIDKRFCFDLELEDTSGKQLTFTLQAVSDADMKRWLSVMDGKEPQIIQTKDFRAKENVYALNETGIECVKKLIKEIEHRGVQHEGIYRLVGVMSKVDFLLHQALQSSTAARINFSDDDEWEINTLTSALKSYFRNLPEPIMTFDLHRDFINAAKCEHHDDRVERVAALVKKLPESNKRVLAVLIEHLEKVQEHHEMNKMTVQNLGVCFGPTLMRQREETVQAIMEIKFSNIIVEILIEERNTIFDESLLLDTEKPDTPKKKSASPKIASKTISHVTRLPSQRLKQQRPRGAVYERASMPNLQEGIVPPNEGTPKFTRSLAIRDNQRRSRSPSPRSTPSSDERRAVLRLSLSSEEDGFGHISPLDLNLDFGDLTTPRDVSTTAPKPAPRREASKFKGDLTPNGSVDTSPDDTESASQQQRLDSPSSVASQPRNDSPADEVPALNADLIQGLVVPRRKKRVSSLLRRQPVTSPGGDGPMYVPADTEKNANNNNNNKHHAESSRSSKLTIPKTLAVTTSIKQKKKKFIASVREGLASPTAPTRHVRKKIYDKSKGLRLSDSSIGVQKSTKSVDAKKRHNSDSQPSALRGAATKDDVSDRSVVQKSLDYEQKNEMSPGSSEMEETRSTDHVVVFTESSEDSDAEITSAVARTLYACEAEHDNELSFQQGEVVRDVRKSEEPGWLYGVLDGRVGLVPRNYVEFLCENEQD